MGTLHEDQYIYIYIYIRTYLAQFFLEWKMFQTNVLEKTKTNILCSVTFFRKSSRFWDNVKKYCKDGQATRQYGARALYTG